MIAIRVRSRHRHAGCRRPNESSLLRNSHKGFGTIAGIGSRQIAATKLVTRKCQDICRNVVLLTLGTGVGGGVVADMYLQEGGSAGGMELGHTLLVMDGEECTCGRRGCLEAYASATGLVRHAKEAAAANPTSLMNEMCKGGQMNGVIPFKAARAGDIAGQKVVDDYIKYLGEGIINFINIL